MRLTQFAFDGHSGVTRADEVAGIGIGFDIISTFVLDTPLSAFADDSQYDLYQGGAESVEVWQAQRARRTTMNGINAVIPILKGYPVVMMLRQRDLTGAYITPDTVASISGAVFDLNSDTPDIATQTFDITVVDTVLTRPKVDSRWTNDLIGYNFLHVLDAFPDGSHFYAVLYSFIPVAGADARFARVIGLKTWEFDGNLACVQ